MIRRTDRHVSELIEALEELLAVPELRCCGPEELFPSTLETLAKARVIRAAVLDELGGLEGGL